MYALNCKLLVLQPLFTSRLFPRVITDVISIAGSSGGICERFKSYSESDGTVKKSLNTGIVTLLNYGARMPTMISTLTFSHEVGHNFGSPVNDKLNVA